MRTTAEVLTWWVVLAVLDLLFLGPVDRTEVLLGAGGALTASVAGVIGRRATHLHYPFALADLRPLAKVPVVVWPESVRLVRLVLSRNRPIGVWGERLLPDRARTGPHPMVATAAWSAGQCATPGAFVAELDEAHAVLHVLRPQVPS